MKNSWKNCLKKLSFILNSFQPRKLNQEWIEMEQNNETFWRIFVYYTLQYLWRLFVAVVTAPRSFLLRPSGYFRRFASVVQEWAKNQWLTFTVQYTTSKSFPNFFSWSQGRLWYFKVPREVQFQIKKIFLDKVWSFGIVCLDVCIKCLLEKCTTTHLIYYAFLIFFWCLLTMFIHSFIAAFIPFLTLKMISMMSYS